MGQFPATTVSFNLAPDASLGAAVSAIEKVQKQMPAPAAMLGTFQGTAQAFVGSLSNEGDSGVVARCSRSTSCSACSTRATSIRITILSTLPSASVGALLALLFAAMS